MYRCIIKTHKYSQYKKTTYTIFCNGELKLGKFNKQGVYICCDCGSIFSRDYVEYHTKIRNV